MFRVSDKLGMNLLTPSPIKHDIVILQDKNSNLEIEKVEMDLVNEF